jgi:hypothetical protein
MPTGVGIGWRQRAGKGPLSACLVVGRDYPLGSLALADGDPARRSAMSASGDDSEGFDPVIAALALNGVDPTQVIAGVRRSTAAGDEQNHEDHCRGHEDCFEVVLHRGLTRSFLIQPLKGMYR